MNIESLMEADIPVCSDLHVDDKNRLLTCIVFYMQVGSEAGRRVEGLLNDLESSPDRYISETIKWINKNIDIPCDDKNPIIN